MILNVEEAAVKPVRKAVIAAAGFGTRFLPQTKAMPKEMLPLVDKPIIQYVVEELVGAGIEDIIIVTGYSKRTIEDHFDAPSRELADILAAGGADKAAFLKQLEDIASMANFTYVRQKGPLGTGSALFSAAHLVGDEAFIYASGDEFIVAEPSRFKQLIQVYKKQRCSVLGCIKAEKDADYDRYGFAGGKELEPGMIEVDRIIEKPGKAEAPSNMATVSGYVLTPDIFGYLEKELRSRNTDREFYYNDGLKLMLADHRRIIAYEVKNAKYYDSGNKVDYIKTMIDLALKRDDIRDEILPYLKDLIK